MNYYISDLHLGHYNAMARFDNRPFKTLDEMDDKIIGNINRVVAENDNLYLLGDISWYTPEKTNILISRITCRNRFLILGNHDKWVENRTSRSLFRGIYDLKRVKDDGRIVILCHYPIAVWDQSHHGSYHLYGHVHLNRQPNGEKTHKLLDHEEMANAFNVGCMMDYMDYTPRTLNEIIKKSRRYQK